MVDSSLNEVTILPHKELYKQMNSLLSLIKSKLNKETVFLEQESAVLSKLDEALSKPPKTFEDLLKLVKNFKEFEQDVSRQFLHVINIVAADWERLLFKVEQLDHLVNLYQHAKVPLPALENEALKEVFDDMRETLEEAIGQVLKVADNNVLISDGPLSASAIKLQAMMKKLHSSQDLTLHDFAEIYHQAFPIIEILEEEKTRHAQGARLLTKAETKDSDDYLDRLDKELSNPKKKESSVKELGTEALDELSSVQKIVAITLVKIVQNFEEETFIEMTENDQAEFAVALEDKPTTPVEKSAEKMEAEKVGTENEGEARAALVVSDAKTAVQKILKDYIDLLPEHKRSPEERMKKIYKKDDLRDALIAEEKNLEGVSTLAASIELINRIKSHFTRFVKLVDVRHGLDSGDVGVKEKLDTKFFGRGVDGLSRKIRNLYMDKKTGQGGQQRLDQQLKILQENTASFHLSHR